MHINLLTIDISHRRGFYLFAAAITLFGILLSVLWCALGLRLATINEPLMPRERSAIPWWIIAIDDRASGGGSTLSVTEVFDSINVEFELTPQYQYPYISVQMFFGGGSHSGDFTDLSSYSHITFEVACGSRNVLSFFAQTYEEELSLKKGEAVYSSPSAFFSCEEDWTKVSINLSHLEVPEWWQNLHHVELSDKSYALNKVHNLAFGATRQSALNQLTKVGIRKATLVGRDWNVLFLMAALLVALWAAAIYGLMKLYFKVLTQEIRAKMQGDLPFVAYKQLSLDPQKDKEKSAVINYIASEYANSELNLELVVATLGMNRNKVCAAIKDELGLTFSAYLNKIRLTEGARLLAEKESAGVAEVAYLVGYNNVSYFNKLFKAEYGCTPVTFQRLKVSSQEDSSRDNP